MTNLKQLPKPNSDISDYEWGITPNTVKAIIERLQQLLQQKQQNLDTLHQENKWLREQLDLRLDRPNRAYTPPVPEILLWAAMGLILTVAGTFLPASSFAAPWSWFGDGFGIQTLGVSYQVGAVLLTACLGGKNAALLSQIAYVLLGLTGLPVFDRGGGLEYLQQPNFGYLIGFIVGAWLCGWLAFQTLVKFSSLIASCLVGLLGIHLVGLIYLVGMYLTTGLGSSIDSLWQGIVVYSLQPFPGQIAVVCAVSLVAFVMRKAMFT
ncbi:biotin transporter BioY [Waterburya agarophytonicola K14]|uniref:Biotin transporter BioY n=1 Tax=Waterburya agarophytonicola KI4 TaxID=2874699 RepID=A0A964BSG6_9CYAN|nr:biotin transporter BioY [Waterburya agarophytonicola]MCC0178908.1 biotin transporter BioY [Waterburya agarophytonicola KI4]